jgi:hypothetical protein
MARIIGYGEDALTYRLLKNSLKTLLIELGDDSEPSDCLVFYRPSLGRKGGCYGEFDGMLVARNSIYLIESKWEGTREMKRGKMNFNVRIEQEDRHKIFSWFLLHWKCKSALNSLKKNEDLSAEFEGEFEGKQIPSSKDTLGKNLEFILNKIFGRFPENTKPSIVNVFLFFRREGSKTVPNIVSSKIQFEPAIIDYSTFEGVFLFDMKKGILEKNDNDPEG